ncbi:transcriptional regulator [Opitutaceae bacterium TAV1]|nr:transcriptional regulator [Opitutaceae bacterium TAV1]
MPAQTHPPVSSITSLQLSTFLAVAESGGVLPAARRINLSQPAVTARIRQLEETLGAALFLRTPRGMTLTPRGRRLLGYARRMAELLAEAAGAVDAAGAAPVEPLTLAASTTPAAHVLPVIIARYQAAGHSLAGFTLRVGNTDQVLGWVRDGTVPLAVVEGQPKASGIHLELFRKDELLPVWAPATLAAAVVARIEKMKRPADLADLPILWREEGSGTRRVVEVALEKAGVPAHAWSGGYQFGGGTDAIKAATLAGLGVAFLPRCAIGAELESGALCPLPLKNLRVPRAFRWATCGSGLSGVAAAFRRFAQRETNQAGTVTSVF